MQHNQTTINTLASILQDLLSFLDQSGVDYALLPYRPVSDLVEKDIDVYIDNLDGFTKILQKFADSRPDIDLIWVKDHATGRRFNLVHRNKNGEHIIFPGPDAICFTSAQHGESESITRCIQRAEATSSTGKILQRQDAHLLYLLKAIDKQKLGKSQKEYLRSLQKKSSGIIDQRVSKLFGKETSLQISSEVEQDSECGTELLQTLDAVIKKTSHARATKFLWPLYRTARRLFSPSGIFIVFIGPDGCGKTSVINKVLPAAKKILSSERHNKFHLRPYFGIKQRASNAPTDDPHNLQLRGAFSSTIKTFYFLADYLAGYFFTVRPLLTRSSIVIFDRYYHDLLIDPKRYRYSGSMVLARIIGRLIPKPDLYILLDAPAKVIQSRKQEVPFSETARQQQAYLDFISTQSRGVVVDASRPLGKVIQDVEQKIIHFASNRTENSIGHL